MTRVTSPGQIYVALCSCGNLVAASRRRDQVEHAKVCIACPPHDGHIRVEQYRHAPVKKRIAKQGKRT